MTPPTTYTSREAVDRYGVEYNGGLSWDVIKKPEGEFVRYSSYKALLTERDAAIDKYSDLADRYVALTEKLIAERAERDALRDQLAAARNEALEEAIKICDRGDIVSADSAAAHIRALKSSAPAPRDGIDTDLTEYTVDQSFVDFIHANCPRSVVSPAPRGVTLPEDLKVSPTTNPPPDTCIHMTSDMLGIKVCEKCGNGHWSDKPCPTCTPAPREATVQEAARVLLDTEKGMTNELNSAGWEFIEAWHDIVKEPLSAMAFNHCKPLLRRVFDHYLRALAQEGQSDG